MVDHNMWPWLSPAKISAHCSLVCHVTLKMTPPLAGTTRPSCSVGTFPFNTKPKWQQLIARSVYCFTVKFWNRFECTIRVLIVDTLGTSMQEYKWRHSMESLPGLPRTTFVIICARQQFLCCSDDLEWIHMAAPLGKTQREREKGERQMSKGNRCRGKQWWDYIFF